MKLDFMQPERARSEKWIVPLLHAFLGQSLEPWHQINRLHQVYGIKSFTDLPPENTVETASSPGWKYRFPFSADKRHTLELLLFRFINRATWVGIVHFWSRSLLDSSSLWAAARLFTTTTWFCKRKPALLFALLMQHTHQGCVVPVHIGRRNLWQRLPACCSTIFRCSPAKQQLCRYLNTKGISYGAETPDVHLYFFFVACFRFPCSVSVL